MIRNRLDKQLRLQRKVVLYAFATHALPVAQHRRTANQLRVASEHFSPYMSSVARMFDAYIFVIFAYLEATISVAQTPKMHHSAYISIHHLVGTDILESSRESSHAQVPCIQAFLIATFQTLNSNGDVFSRHQIETTILENHVMMFSLSRL